jgi:hypothetical protein
VTEHLKLLGGAKRVKPRPRGFITSWSPQAHTKILLEQVDAVLEEYQDYLPLTCRQIFYRLVGKYGYEKTNKAYARLCEALMYARRAGRISMADIRDDGNQHIAPVSWQSEEDFLRYCQRRAKAFRLDRQQGQRRRLFVMCEAAGMAPQLAETVDDYGITVLSGGGFQSVTANHEFAQRLGGDAEILHIGDHDPSGVHLYIALVEDITAFAEAYGISVKFSRLAVTPDQIEELELDTAPPKDGERRAFAGETCQAEAIPPDTLADILLRAVEDRIDEQVREDVLEIEAEIRERLVERFGG